MRLIARIVIFMGMCLALGLVAQSSSRGQEAQSEAQVAPSIFPDTTTTRQKGDYRTDTVPEELYLGEAVFKELHLSHEGVTAVDSVGRRWWYDFADDYFVRDRREPAGNLGSGTNAPYIDPVEVRCTTELHVGMPALKPVYVEYNEYVEGDIFANGRVTVDGWVKGNIQSYGDLVLVTASGRVDGYIRAPEIKVNDGGIVLGDQTITPRIALPSKFIIDSFSAAGIWVVFGFTIFLLLVAFLTASLGPKQLSTIDTCIRTHVAKSAAIGLVSIFLLPAVIVLLVLTVVGTVVVPVLFLVVIPVALVTGMMTTARTVFRPLLNRSGTRGRTSLLFESTLGVLVFMLMWTIVAVLLGSSDDIAIGFGYFFLVISILLSTVPLLLGVGATVLTRMGFRPYVGFGRGQGRDDRSAPAPAPPPMPTAPGETPSWSSPRPIPRPPRPQPPRGPSPGPPNPGDR